MTAAPMTIDAFKALLKPVTDSSQGKTLDISLEQELNQQFPPQSLVFAQIFNGCRAAIHAGWMCARENSGIKYGRVIKPHVDLNGFSVDVVEMNSIKGPHHSHPNGEIDLIMPLTPGAKFDGREAGWMVYGPGTAHHPTVTEGCALVLYLLPQGAIEFTR